MTITRTARPSLRCVVLTDEPRLREIFVAVRSPPMVAAGLSESIVASLLSQQFDLQRVAYEASYPDAVWNVIESSDEVVGRLITWDGPTGTVLVDIVIDPARQREGIGTAVLDALLTDARDRERPVALRVDRGSPAEAWYLAHDFVEVGADQLQLHLAYRPTRTTRD